MRKIIVNNLVTLDGYYEGKNRNLNSLFEYFHSDYSHDESVKKFRRRKCS